MAMFEKLRSVALQQNQAGDFPVWLLDEVIGIADNPARYIDKKQLVKTLISQIIDYDPYAGAGCFDSSVGAEAIQATLRKLNATIESKTCELMPCCQFFSDNFKHMPKSEEYIKEKLCFGDYGSCNRFKIYLKYGGKNLPPDLDPYDAEEVKKVIKCQQDKKRLNK